jgi:hypothetical protein
VPAAAVIPAPIAYIKVVAVKKLVVGFLEGRQCPMFRVQRCLSILQLTFLIFIYWSRALIFYLEKIRVFQAGLRRNTLAWNNRIGL